MLHSRQGGAMEKVALAIGPALLLAVLARLLAMPWLDWCALAWLLGDVATLRALPVCAHLFAALRGATVDGVAPSPRALLVARALPWLALLGVTFALLWPLLLGRMPASRDHAIHLMQTRVFVDELVPTGRTWGYSERILPGWFAGESYPWLAYALTGAAYLLSGGAISLATSYAWGLASMWIGGALSVRWLARTIVLELSPVAPESTSTRAPPPSPQLQLCAAWAGAIAASLWLTDPGASREGGWEYLMFHGVWPQQLSVVLWIASLASLWSLLRAPSVRWIASTALLGALALLAHPFAMPLLVLGWLVLLVAFALMAAPRTPDLTRVLAVLAAVLLAALISGAGVTRFLEAAPRMGRTPVLWRPLASLARDIVLGEGFAARRAWLFPLAIIGGVGAWRGRLALGVAVAALFLATLLVASEESIGVVQLHLLLGGLHNVQFPRFSIALTPLVAALAGVGALRWYLPDTPRADCPVSTPPAPQPPGAPTTAQGTPPWREATLRWLFALLVIAPLLSWAQSGVLARAPVAARLDLETSAHKEHARALAFALTELKRESAEAASLATAKAPAGEQAAGAGARSSVAPLGTKVRIALLREGSRGATWPLLIMANVGIDGVVLEGHVPTLNVEQRVLSHDPAVLAELGVTHVLYFGRIKAGDALGTALAAPRKFGPVRLAALVKPPARKSLPLVGAGQRFTFAVPEIAAASPSTLGARLDADGAHVLAISPHPRLEILGPQGPVEWRATSIHRGLVGVRLSDVTPGTYEVHFQLRFRERALEILSLIAALAALGLLLVNLPLAPRAISFRQRKWLPLLVTALIFALLGAAYLRRNARLADAWLGAAGLKTKPRQVDQDQGATATQDSAVTREVFRGELELELAQDRVSSPARGCDGIDARDARAGCDPADEQLRASVHYIGKSLFGCRQIPVPPRSSVTLSWSRGSPSSDVLLLLTATEDGNAGLAFALAGDKAVALPREKRVWSRWVSGQPGAETLTLSNRGRVARRVCASAAELEQVVRYPVPAPGRPPQ